MDDDLYTRNDAELRRDERFNNWVSAICCIGTIVLAALVMFPEWKELIP